MASSSSPIGIFRVLYAKADRPDAIKVKLICERSQRCRLSDSIRMRVIKYGEHHKSLRATVLSAKGHYAMTLTVARGRLTLKSGQARVLIVKLDKVGRRLVLAGRRVLVRFTLSGRGGTIADGRTSFVLSLTK